MSIESNRDRHEYKCKSQLWVEIEELNNFSWHRNVQGRMVLETEDKAEEDGQLAVGLDFWVSVRMIWNFKKERDGVLIIRN